MIDHYRCKLYYLYTWWRSARNDVYSRLALINQRNITIFFAHDIATIETCANLSFLFHLINQIFLSWCLLLYLAVGGFFYQAIVLIWPESVSDHIIPSYFSNKRESFNQSISLISSSWLLKFTLRCGQTINLITFNVR